MPLQIWIRVLKEVKVEHAMRRGRQIVIAKQLKAAYTAFYELVEKSPKDTGRFRRSWFLSHDGNVDWTSLPTDVIYANEPNSVSVDIPEQTKRIAGYGPASPQPLTVFLTQVAIAPFEPGGDHRDDSDYYWDSLNAGQSKQATAGFIQRAVNRGIVAARALVLRRGDIVGPDGNPSLGGLNDPTSKP